MVARPSESPLTRAPIGTSPFRPMVHHVRWTSPLQNFDLDRVRRPFQTYMNLDPAPP